MPACIGLLCCEAIQGFVWDPVCKSADSKYSCPRNTQAQKVIIYYKYMKIEG